MGEQEAKLDEVTADQAEPELLYHYTTLDGLLGILKDEVLWAAGIPYLNDTSEFKAGSGAVFDLMQTEIMSCSDIDPATDDLSKIFNAKFDDAKVASVMNRYTPLIRQSAASVYAASFSAEETGDDLSQWRAYGGQDSGVSLGFEPLHLREMGRQFLNNNPGWVGADTDPLAKCEYYKDRNFPQTDPAIHDAVKRIMELNDDSSKVLSFARYSATLKHEKFRAEGEWRIVLVWGGAGVPDAVKFRRVRSLVVPYICIPLKLDNRPIEIVRIVVGPTPHKTEARQSIEMLLKRYDVQYREIVESRVPYRNW
jgi:hypothetical protein